MRYTVLEKHRGFPWDIVLAIVFALVIFVGVVFFSGLISIVTTVVGILLFGVIQYFIWGRASVKTSRLDPVLNASRLAEQQVVPAETFDLALTDVERAELILVLEQSLAPATGVASDATFNPPSDALRREILERLRGFGA